MKLNYIIEICVAIDIAILGIAYPIIINQVGRIGDRYNSKYLLELFNNESPQKKICTKYRLLNLSLFKFTFYSTISSLIFLVLQFPPPKTNIPILDWIIGNSAEGIVFILTVSLVIFFIIWMNKISLYNGKSTTILTRIIKKYDLLKEDNLLKEESAIKTYHLKTINEFACYAINKSDKHLQEELLQFYSLEFLEIRRNHDKSKPLEYPYEFYEFVYDLIYEFVNKKKVQLPALEHRAVSGLWLLGQDSEEITISDKTYCWLWRNLNLICKEEGYIKSYWSTAHQYFDTKLELIDIVYRDGSIQNEEEIKKRDNERDEFLERNYALGGLLLYTKQYKSIGNILQYTQSYPPSYALLPESMTDVFSWFEEFRNEFKEGIYKDLKYPFPGLDNLGNSRQVIYWVCSYITLLFIRQFSRIKIYTYQDFTSLPQLPENTLELYNWYDSLPFFKKCLKDLLENKELLLEVKGIDITETKRVAFFEFLKKLEKKIKEKVSQKKLDATLSDNKIKSFNNETKEIIKHAFNEFKDIFIPLEDNETEKTDLKLKPRSFTTLFPKNGFTDDEDVSDFNTVLANRIANGVIKKDIPNSFLASVTKRYLLNIDNVIEGIKKLKINNNDFVIVSVNINSQLAEKLADYESILRKTPSTHREIRNTLFILKKDDLPTIKHEELSEKEIEKNNLKLIDDNLKLYTSLEELNDEEKAQQEKNLEKTDNPKDIQVKIKVSIAFLSLITWKKQREVVQINIESQFREQGIPNSVNDVKPFKKR